ncbi:MAG: hypothetical protein O7F12_01380 [Nitrospirae bacterium]|nr:hypothetical protein [Nitrospirota bacterium]
MLWRMVIMFHKYVVLMGVWVCVGSVTMGLDFPIRNLYAQGSANVRNVGMITNPHPSVFDGFGMALDVKENRVLIGASHEENGGVESGRVYLMDGMNGRVLHQYSLSRPLGHDLFGFSVKFMNDKVLVGAPQGRDRQQGHTGAVYVFEGDSGKLLQTLHNPSPGTGTFGHAVDSHDGLIMVGDPMTSLSTTFHAGAVFVFESSSGTLLYSVQSPEKQTGEPDRFGHAVAFVENNSLVTAPLGGSDPSDSGRAYLFEGRTGKHIRTFQSPSPQNGEFFGWSAAVDGHTVIFGALGHNKDSQVEVGVAYVMDVLSGQILYRVEAPAGATGDHFGEAVAIVDGKFLVGAPGTDMNSEILGVDVGAVYVFEKETGTLLDTLENPEPETGAADLFGLSLAGAGTKMVVGAPFGGTIQHTDSGVVHQYVFQGRHEGEG